jgi:monoamine oxidase
MAGGSTLKGIAIIGGGLSGLSAAYHLNRRGIPPITIFERENCLGGRVLTWEQPDGEHGAEYLLKSELDPRADERSDYHLDNGETLRSLLRTLTVKLEDTDQEWPYYFSNGQFEKANPKSTALFTKTERSFLSRPDTQKWQSLMTGRHKKIQYFVETLLAGETCAPIDHISGRYRIGCLESSISPKERWYRIRGGSRVLIEQLRGKSTVSVKQGTDCIAVEEQKSCVRVRWEKDGCEKMANFDVAIITAPDGERLLGSENLVSSHEPLAHLRKNKIPPSPPLQKWARGNFLSRHFHGYISVLLEYANPPKHASELERGLYLRSPLNYIKLTESTHGWVLRILIPNADRLMRYSDSQILKLANDDLNQILAAGGQWRRYSIKKWRFGLPCGAGSGQHFHRVENRIYLAGDRFSRWPSMAGAIVSGSRVARAVANSI